MHNYMIHIILKVDGKEYTTYTNLFDVVDKNLE